MSYRPEIDGLRALAVLPVVFFHSQLRFSGGYVGVDIFFVISGYLITALIAADLAAGKFSLREFWERRIRRIMPAATVTVAACLVLGLVVMLPTDFEELGRSAVAQALLSANIFFFQETGYFASPADSKPLLHFWSLAVEEQFYLLFPFLLMGLHRVGKRAMTVGVGVVAVVSLGVSAVGVMGFPNATFYLLPTRAWELAAGALLALRGGRLPLPEKARGILGWAGMALMVAPMFLYDGETPFPGVAALPPCVGAVLVIWATGAKAGAVGARAGVGVGVSAKVGERAEMALRRLLTLRPVVFVGLISYSLYLWHWPVKVFSHYWFTGIYSPLGMRVLVVVVSVGLAWVSWRYVERPFRAKRSAIPARVWFGGAVAASGLTIAAGVGIAAGGGLPGRFPAEIVQYASAYEDRPKIEEADLTIEAAEEGDLRELAPPPARDGSILLWGDSHARVVSPALEEVCRELGVEGHRASRSETASLLEWGEEEMRDYNDAVFRWVATHRPTVVVLVSRWEKVLRTPDDEESLRVTVDAIQKLGVQVAIMRQVASQRRDIPKTLARAALLGEEVDEVGIPVAEHAQFTHRSNEMINRVARATPRLMVLDPIPYLSRDGRCIAEEAGRPLYYDYQHLTRFGAGFLEPMFESMMRAVSARRRQARRMDDAPGTAVRPGGGRVSARRGRT